MAEPLPNNEQRIINLLCLQYGFKVLENEIRINLKDDSKESGFLTKGRSRFGTVYYVGDQLDVDFCTLNIEAAYVFPDRLTAIIHAIARFSPRKGETIHLIHKIKQDH